MTSRIRLLFALICVIPVGMGACSSDDADGDDTTDGGGASSSSSGGSGTSSSSGHSSSSSGNTTSSSGGSSGSTSSSGGSSGSTSSSSGDADASVDTDAAADASTCAAVESCDGVVDDNCNGTVDEGCGRCPLLTLACPGGCCAVDRWQVNDLASGYGSSIAVDPAGNIFFVYTRPNSGGWNTTMSIYDAVPGTWRTVEIGVGGMTRNTVLLDSDNNVHVLYGNFTGNYALLYRHSEDHGVTFSDPQTVGILAIGATADMALDSQGKPHVAYGNSKQPSSSFPGLTYASLVDGAWQKEPLDLATGSPDAIDLEVGFADRPTIVISAYHPEGASTFNKRAVFHNGNRWVYENFDQLGDGQVYPSSSFTEHSLRLLPDASMDVLFTRSDDNVAKLYLSHRTPGDDGTWSTTPITGVTSFLEPTLFRDAEGRRAAISDGISVQREDAAGTWSTTSAGVPGTTVAQARRGRFLYLGYTDTGNSNRPTVSVVDLGAP